MEPYFKFHENYFLAASPKTIGLAQLIAKRQTNDLLRLSPILLGWDYSFTKRKKKKKKRARIFLVSYIVLF